MKQVYRNAGRKKIPDPVRLDVLIPKENETEIRDIIKSFQDAAILKQSLKNKQP